MSVTHAYNSSYLGDWDWEDSSLRPNGVSSSQDCISKISKAKWIGGVAEMINHLHCKHHFTSQIPEFKFQSQQQKKL
jgi:hypothetical protein